MWTRTSESTPPKGEHLAVVHKLSSRGESVDEDAVWDGRSWTRLALFGRAAEPGLPRDYYYLWRRLET